MIATAPATATGGGSGSAVPASAPAAGLAFDKPPDDPPEASAVAFAGKVPRLPAVSADGTLLAVFGYPGTGPMMPPPIDIELHQVDSDIIRETLPLLDEEEASAAGERADTDRWTPALRRTLAERGSAALARLRGFHSLEPVTIDRESSGDARLTTAGVDAAAAARTDLVAIGSGPGERAVFARAWNAAWKGKVTAASVFGRALPSGTTGWVGASIELAKPGYKVAFTVFAVFDRAADRSWSLVHIHFAA